jgi:hypothetical protein
MLSTFVGGAGIYIAGLLRDSHINLNVVYQFASLIIVVCAGLLWIAKQQIKKK